MLESQFVKKITEISKKIPEPASIAEIKKKLEDMGINKRTSDSTPHEILMDIIRNVR